MGIRRESAQAIHDRVVNPRPRLCVIAVCSAAVLASNPALLPSRCSHVRLSARLLRELRGCPESALANGGPAGFGADSKLVVSSPSPALGPCLLEWQDLDEVDDDDLTRMGFKDLHKRRFRNKAYGD